MVFAKGMLIFAVVSTLYVSYVGSHASMVMPHSWVDDKTWIPKPDGSFKFDYVGMKSGMQCYSGCDIPGEDLCPGKGPIGCSYPNPGCACMWYKNWTFVEKPTLFDPKLRTYPHTSHQQHILHHPWRAPGFAPVDSPCGVAGGNLHGCIGGECAHRKGGFGYGPKAEDVHFKHKAIVTNWTRGDVVEAAFGIIANHGGGYSYRLCKVPEKGFQGLTEECFQKTPLQFVGTTQWVQYGEDVTTRVEFPAARVSTGTNPEGSQWTKNPIPACNGGSGGFDFPSAECPNGTQFPPPKPGLQGYGVNIARTVRPFQFSIIDKLHIPKGLEPGDYVLSFRWDTEQTPQVWNTCASIFLE